MASIKLLLKEKGEERSSPPYLNAILKFYVTENCYMLHDTSVHKKTFIISDFDVQMIIIQSNSVPLFHFLKQTEVRLQATVY